MSRSGTFNDLGFESSDDSDKPGLPPRLVKAYIEVMMGRQGLRVLHANSEDSDKTGRIMGWMQGPNCWFCYIQLNSEYPK